MKGLFVTGMEMMMICSSEVQVSPTTPVERVPGVPDGIGIEEGELAAVLRDLADLGYLHPVAELGLLIGILGTFISRFPVVFLSFDSCQCFVLSFANRDMSNHSKCTAFCVTKITKIKKTPPQPLNRRCITILAYGLQY